MTRFVEIVESHFDVVVQQLIAASELPVREPPVDDGLQIEGPFRQVHETSPLQVVNQSIDFRDRTMLCDWRTPETVRSTMSRKLVNWNVNWATPRSKRSPEILDRINQHSPEIVCLTETHAGLLQGGHAICAGPDYGNGRQKTRRKVMLWSREPWEHVDDIGDERLPPGRFISGVTRTSPGELTAVGVCIPWSGSGPERDTAANAGERGKTTRSISSVLPRSSRAHPRTGSWCWAISTSGSPSLLGGYPRRVPTVPTCSNGGLHRTCRSPLQSSNTVAAEPSTISG